MSKFWLSRSKFRFIRSKNGQNLGRRLKNGQNLGRRSNFVEFLVLKVKIPGFQVKISVYQVKKWSKFGEKVKKWSKFGEKVKKWSNFGKKVKFCRIFGSKGQNFGFSSQNFGLSGQKMVKIWF